MFFRAVLNFSSSVAACLHRVGVGMPHSIERVPVLHVSTVVDALKAILTGEGPEL